MSATDIINSIRTQYRNEKEENAENLTLRLLVVGASTAAVGVVKKDVSLVGIGGAYLAATFASIPTLQQHFGETKASLYDEVDKSLDHIYTQILRLEDNAELVLTDPELDLIEEAFMKINRIAPYSYKMEGGGGCRGRWRRT